MTYQVDISEYYGPLELLLHIVRREELALCDLPLAKITQQYLDYLEVLVELAIDDVADFIEIASVLVEMKSKQAIPRGLGSEDSPDVAGGAAEGDTGVPATDTSADNLVARLFEYRRIRDAGSILDEQAQRWQLRYSRLANDLPPRRTDIGQQPIEPIEVWDLVSAFARILRERQPPPQANVIYDDTPIHVHMQRIHAIVRDSGRVELTSLFESGMHKSALVAMFLATLELTRHYGLTTEQTDAGHPLYLIKGDRFKEQLDVHEIDNLTFEKVASSNLPVAPR